MARLFCLFTIVTIIIFGKNLPTSKSLDSICYEQFIDNPLIVQASVFQNYDGEMPAIGLFCNSMNLIIDKSKVVNFDFLKHGFIFGVKSRFVHHTSCSGSYNLLFCRNFVNEFLLILYHILKI
jgi:hypothetical protein